MGPSRDGVLIPSDDKEDEGERESEQFVGLGGGKASKKYSNQRKMNYSVMIGSVEDEASHLFADFEVNYYVKQEQGSAEFAKSRCTTSGFFIDHFFGSEV